MYSSSSSSSNRKQWELIVWTVDDMRSFGPECTDDKCLFAEQKAVAYIYIYALLKKALKMYNVSYDKLSGAGRSATTMV